MNRPAPAWSLLTALCLPASAAAGVTGRSLRIEAPASPRMSVGEIAVTFAGGGTLDPAAVAVSGDSFDGAPLAGHPRNHAANLFDGQGADPKKVVRSDAPGPDGTVNPWIEVDLGRERTIDSVTVALGTPQYRDRRLRLVSLLDADRRVTFAGTAMLPKKSKGNVVETFRPGRSGRPSLVGRRVPEASRGWAPLGEVIDDRIARPAPTRTAEQRRRWRERNDPAGLERTANELFARLRPDVPELAAARAAHEAGDHAGALNLWRDRFLANLADATVWVEHELPRRSYPREADDLLAGVAVQLPPESILPWAVEPGTIDWAALGDGPKGARFATLEVLRRTALVNEFPKSLLAEYAATGDRRYLDGWAAYADDWAMHFQSDADAAPLGPDGLPGGGDGHDVRDYFSKETVQQFNEFARQLQLALAERPELANELPAATLARMLFPVLDEYGPA